MVKMFRKQVSNRKGFTLVELLVVVAIIGILAAIAIPKFTSANTTARGAKVQADLRTLDSASQIYNASAGSYTDITGLVAGNVLAAAPKALSASTEFVINGSTYTAAGDYTVDASSGRAKYNSKTVEQY